MYWTMLRRELIGRRRQTIVVAVGLAIAIALVIVVSSLSAGITKAQAEALEGVTGVGTDLTVTGQPSTPEEGGGGPRFDFGSSDGEETADGTTRLAQSNLMSEPGRGTLAAEAVEQVASADGVAAATGALSLMNTSFSGEMPDFSAQSDGGSASAPGAPPQGGGMGGGSSFGIDSFAVLGVDPAATAFGPLAALEVVEGRALAASDGDALVAVVDESYAASAEVAVGDLLNVGGTDVEVVGIVASTTDSADTAADVFLDLGTAQDLAGLEDVVSTVYVSADSASRISALQADLEELLPDATVSSQADLAEQVSGSLSSAAALITNLGTWLSLIVLAVALAIAALLTSSGVTRRTREFGTLKAIGWSNGRIVGQLAGESAVQAAMGGLAGLAIGLGAVGIINLVAPVLQVTGGSGGSGAPGGNGGAGSGGVAGGPPGFGGADMPGMGGGAGAASEIVLQAPVTPWVVAAALGLALLGGLVAGSIAAFRAARLSPAVALRTVS